VPEATPWPSASGSRHSEPDLESIEHREPIGVVVWGEDALAVHERVAGELLVDA
jgi:hypothetical protein